MGVHSRLLASARGSARPAPPDRVAPAGAHHGLRRGCLDQRRSLRARGGRLRHGGSGAVGLGLLAGAFSFYLGDLAIDHFGGDERKSATGGQDAGTGLAILLGTVLDGIPESIVLGLSLPGGEGVS